MFRGELLIDGYNLLHAAGFARRRYGPGEFERTRHRLLELLAGQLFERERSRTRVVFDAPQQTLGPSPPTRVHGMQILFADRDGDADAAIERLIQQNSAPRRLHVISSDHRLQRAARRRRAKFLDSDRFLIRIAQRPTPEERARLSEPPEKREGLAASGEIDVWLRAFAGVEAMIPPPSPAPSPPPQDSTTPAARKAAAEATPEDPRLSTADELTFWQERIAELWEHARRSDR